VNALLMRSSMALFVVRAGYPLVVKSISLFAVGGIVERSFDIRKRGRFCPFTSTARMTLPGFVETFEVCCLPGCFVAGIGCARD